MKTNPEIDTKDITKIIGTQYIPQKIEKEMEDALVKRAYNFIEKQDGENIPSKQWAIRGNTYWPCSESVKELPAGIYSAGMTMGGDIYFIKHKVLSDEIISLPDEASDEVLKHIAEFRQLRTRFNELGFIYKRGILMWGPQGSGKTVTVIQVMKSFVDDGGIAFMGNNPRLDSIALKELRDMEPDRPIVTIYEDVDDIVYYYGDRSLTKLLDGEDNIDNVLFLATTNYPERLPARLINRPSRFDVVKFIGLPSEQARYKYLEAKTNLSLGELKIWSKKTEGLSIPHLKELIILVKVYEKSLDDAIKTLKHMRIIPNSSSVAQERRRDYSPEQTIKIELEDTKKETAPPVINVEVVTKDRVIKRIERDSNGLITRVIEETDSDVEDIRDK